MGVSLVLITLCWSLYSTVQATPFHSIHVKNKTMCYPQLFACRDFNAQRELYHCINWVEVCDGLNTCDDGSDELSCDARLEDLNFCNDTSPFMCEDRSGCVDVANICDGEDNCDDGSDEKDCPKIRHNVFLERKQKDKDGRCKHHQCDRCVSRAHYCDSIYDCKDKSDEYPKMCGFGQYIPDEGPTLWKCPVALAMPNRTIYRCRDQSYCLEEADFCDGTPVCRDGSDEGHFCSEWPKMCTNFSCADAFPNSTCEPHPDGPRCKCPTDMFYDRSTKRCESPSPCAKVNPVCAHNCHETLLTNSSYYCSCQPGYDYDEASNTCNVTEPEPLLFFTTESDIYYVKLTSKEKVHVVNNIKKPRAVAFDGTYVYWTATAPGHQAIYRAILDDVEHTTEVIASLGLHDPAKMAVDHVREYIYFIDTLRRQIIVCATNGSDCVLLSQLANNIEPKFIALDVDNFNIYWSDTRGREGPMILTAKMNGDDEKMILRLPAPAEGLTVDSPAKRLYFVCNRDLHGVKLDSLEVYSYRLPRSHHPYSAAAFASAVYFADRGAILSVSQVNMAAADTVVKIEDTIYDLHIYHPLLKTQANDPCDDHNCSTLCLPYNATQHTCGCHGYYLAESDDCNYEDAYPNYVAVFGGDRGALFRIGVIGSLESRVAKFIVPVTVTAYYPDTNTLFVFDQLRRFFSSLWVPGFQRGLSPPYMLIGLINIIDMDVDYVARIVYLLDGLDRALHAFSPHSGKMSNLRSFPPGTTPVTMCIVSKVKKILIVFKTDEGLYMNSFDLDGENPAPVIGYVDVGGSNDAVNLTLKGPVVKLTYSERQHCIYLADDGNKIILHGEPSIASNIKTRTRIDTIAPLFIHWRVVHRLATSVTSMAMVGSVLFWTDAHHERLYWSDRGQLQYPNEETTPRRVEFKTFPAGSTLTVAPASLDIALEPNPCPELQCTDVCVRSADGEPRCVCSLRRVMVGDVCQQHMECGIQAYCYKSNQCMAGIAFCDGIPQCPHHEDEEGCERTLTTTTKAPLCPPNHRMCLGECWTFNETCPSDVYCPEYQCDTGHCLPAAMRCDGRRDCVGGDDELDHCRSDPPCGLPHQHRCEDNSCIAKKFVCDGNGDCPDESDENNCDDYLPKRCKPAEFACQHGQQCIPALDRCDGVVDCGDKSDELDCVRADDDMTGVMCREEQFACENEYKCLPFAARCNGIVECISRSDEAGCPPAFCDAPDAKHSGKDCINRTEESRHSTTPLPRCAEGFHRCDSGQCVEIRHVCDGVAHCQDRSDEGPLCALYCVPNKCEQACYRSPRGPMCHCHEGYRMEDTKCVETDDCAAMEVCAQVCVNIPRGTHLCFCYRGYELGDNRASCKSPDRALTIYYANATTVTVDNATGPLQHRYSNHEDASIAGIDVDVRKGLIFLFSHRAGPVQDMLQKIDGDREDIIEGIGRNSMMAYDWISGNVYVAGTPGYLRVCTFENHICAYLHRLPAYDYVAGLTVDPANFKLFYCATKHSEAVVWHSDLFGKKWEDLPPIHECMSMAIDSYSKLLYIAGTDHILKIDYDGKRRSRHSDSPFIRMPSNLAFFEEHVYFMSSRTKQLRRCLTHSARTCNVLYQDRRVEPNAELFVLSHKLLQRNDLVDKCKNNTCRFVCVPTRSGPVCICEDGAVDSGTCLPVTTPEPFLESPPGLLPSPPVTRRGKWFYDLATSWVIQLLGVGLIAIGVFCLYWRVCRQNRPHRQSDGEPAIVMRPLQERHQDPQRATLRRRVHGGGGGGEPRPGPPGQPQHGSLADLPSSPSSQQRPALSRQTSRKLSDPAVTRTPSDLLMIQGQSPWNRLTAVWDFIWRFRSQPDADDSMDLRNLAVGAAEDQSEIVYEDVEWRGTDNEEQANRRRPHYMSPGLSHLSPEFTDDESNELEDEEDRF